MKINKVFCAYFSTGGTSKTIATTVAESFSDTPFISLNLTDYDTRQKSYTFNENDLLILAAPAYAGRLPVPVVEAIGQFKAKNTPVAMIVTYGNRAVDDTLMEMNKCLYAQGFIPCAAATFSCQHTYLEELAAGRPDAADLSIATQLGQNLKIKFSNDNAYSSRMPKIPGSYPYVKPPMAPFPFVVETNESCFYCMICAGACPMQAIDFSDPFKIDNDKCLRCKACMQVCPAQAKYFTPGPFEALQERLRPCIDTRQEPWYVIG